MFRSYNFSFHEKSIQQMTIEIIVQVGDNTPFACRLGGGNWGHLEAKEKKKSWLMKKQSPHFSYDAK